MTRYKVPTRYSCLVVLLVPFIGAGTLYLIHDVIPYFLTTNDVEERTITADQQYFWDVNFSGMSCAELDAIWGPTSVGRCALEVDEPPTSYLGRYLVPAEFDPGRPRLIDPDDSLWLNDDLVSLTRNNPELPYDVALSSVGFGSFGYRWSYGHRDTGLIRSFH